MNEANLCPQLARSAKHWRPDRAEIASSLPDVSDVTDTSSAGGRGARIVDELAPAPGEHRLEKKAFHSPELAPLLRALRVSEVYVAGTSANSGVYAACLAAFELSLRVRAITDCVSGLSEEFREPWLRNVDRYLGALVTLDEFVRATAASP